MDRKILFLLAAIAGICAAVLLLPSRDNQDADVAVGRDQPTKAEPATTSTTTKSYKRYEDEEDKPGKQRRQVPEAKEAAADASEARRSSVYYKHSQSTGKYWQHLGNLLWSAGDQENAKKAREVAKGLRRGSRPDATGGDQYAAVEKERELWEALREIYTEGDIATVLDNLAGPVSELESEDLGDASQDGEEGADEPQEAGEEEDQEAEEEEEQEEEEPSAP